MAGIGALTHSINIAYLINCDLIECILFFFLYFICRSSHPSVVCSGRICADIQLLLVMGCVLVAAPRPEDTSVNCQAADTSTAEDALHSSTASGVTKSNSVEKQFLGLVCAGIQVCYPL